MGVGFGVGVNIDVGRMIAVGSGVSVDEMTGVGVGIGVLIKTSSLDGVGVRAIVFVVLDAIGGDSTVEGEIVEVHPAKLNPTINSTNT